MDQDPSKSLDGSNKNEELKRQLMDLEKQVRFFLNSV